MSHRPAAGAPPRIDSLDLDVEETDETLVLRLAGEFDLAGVGPIENVLDRLSTTPRLRRLVFDLRDLDFLDLAGLRTILRANDRGRAAECDVLVVRPRGMANRVFTLTRAGEELQMVDSLDA